MLSCMRDDLLAACESSNWRFQFQSVNWVCLSLLDCKQYEKLHIARGAIHRRLWPKPDDYNLWVYGEQILL